MIAGLVLQQRNGLRMVIKAVEATNARALTEVTLTLHDKGLHTQSGNAWIKRGYCPLITGILVDAASRSALNNSSDVWLAPNTMRRVTVLAGHCNRFGYPVANLDGKLVVPRNLYRQTYCSARRRLCHHPDRPSLPSARWLECSSRAFREPFACIRRHLSSRRAVRRHC